MRVCLQSTEMSVCMLEGRKKWKEKIQHSLGDKSPNQCKGGYNTK